MLTLKLPSLDKRETIGLSLIKLFIPYGQSWDDTHIYFLMFRASFFISAIFLLLNILSIFYDLTFNFYFFNIDLPRTDFIKPFLFTYTFYVPVILVALVLPFYYVKMRANVDFKTADLLLWHPIVRGMADNEKIKFVNKHIMRVVFLLLCAFFSTFALPYQILRYSHIDGSSIWFFCIVGFFLVWILSVCNTWILVSLSIKQNYSHKYKKEKML